jgi:hypothetical protein
VHEKVAAVNRVARQKISGLQGNVQVDKEVQRVREVANNENVIASL